MWLILKVFKMFISQGQSGSHLLKKLGWGLPDSSWMANGSRCCTSHLHGTSSGQSLQNSCRFPWSVQWCASCGYSWLWFGCCWGNWCSSWGCWCRSHWEHPRWELWCSWGYISADGHVWLDSIWMTFMDVIMCTSVLASANDLNQVWAMSGLMDDCGWEPEGLGITEYRCNEMQVHRFFSSYILGTDNLRHPYNSIVYCDSSFPYSIQIVNDISTRSYISIYTCGYPRIKGMQCNRQV